MDEKEQISQEEQKNGIRMDHDYQCNKPQDNHKPTNLANQQTKRKCENVPHTPQKRLKSNRLSTELINLNKETLTLLYTLSSNIENIAESLKHIATTLEAYLGK